VGLIILTLLGLKYLPGWVKLVWLFHPANRNDYNSPTLYTWRPLRRFLFALWL